MTDWKSKIHIDVNFSEVKCVKVHFVEFPGSLVVRVPRFYCCDPRFPGQGTPQAVPPGQTFKKIKNK